MIDFDAAVAAVQDPNADPVLLAKIAYENPEFGANVVANPRAYPGLKRWVAEFGDERARQQLVAMGWPVPQEGVQPQEEADAVAQQQAVAQQPVAQQQYVQSADLSASNDVSTEYIDPYTNPENLSEVADYSAVQQQYVAPQEVPAEQAGFTAELALTTTDQMLMARIASEAPELRPCLARNPNIYPELLAWLGQLNDSAVNAAIRLRQ